MARQRKGAPFSSPATYSEAGGHKKGLQRLLGMNKSWKKIVWILVLLALLYFALPLIRDVFFSSPQPGINDPLKTRQVSKLIILSSVLVAHC